MKITIVGGGNIGTQFAVHAAEKGHEVIVFTSNPDHFSGHLEIASPDGRVTHEGDISFATNNPAKAFREADMIMITMPPTMMIPLAEIIFDNTDEHTMIGFVPGNGGFELAFRKCIERGNAFFGIDRVPAIARLTERGKTVRCSGYKDRLYVGALPGSRTEECAALIESIYDIPCVRLPGFMALTLTPSNPILHTARLKTIFADYEPGVTYDKVPLFYEEWDDPSSELLMACDDEIQAICRALPDFGLEYVVSEREFYNAETVEEMTRAISTEESLLGLTTPTAIEDELTTLSMGLEGQLTRRQQRREAVRRHMERRAAWREKVDHRRREYIENTEGMSRRERSEYISERLHERRSERRADAVRSLDITQALHGQIDASKPAAGSQNLSCAVNAIDENTAAGQTNTDPIEKRLIPDLHSRYFTADFPYGLTVIQQIGRIAGVDMPNIDGLIEWYDGIAVVNDKLILSDYGITDMESLREFYLQ